MRPTNTHIVATAFDYYRAQSVEEALAALGDGGDASFLAGGTDFLVQIKMERHAPKRLVDLSRIAELHEIRSNDGFEVGAMASIRRLAKDQDIQGSYLALAEACRTYSTTQIMIMATVGGNICNASPAADTVPALLAFDANVNLVSGAGSRTVQLKEFFLGPGLTVRQDDELLRSVSISVPKEPTGSTFRKASRVAADIAKVNVAVRLTRNEGRVAECRIALGSVAPKPFRAEEAEAQCVEAGRLDPQVLADVAATAASESSPITDVRSSEDYRRHVTRVLVRDSLAHAWQRAGGRIEQ